MSVLNIGVMWPTARECLQVQRALRELEVQGLRLSFDTGPWLSISADVYLEPPKELALWRATGAVYVVGPDGAVDEEPLEPAAWELELGA